MCLTGLPRYINYPLNGKFYSNTSPTPEIIYEEYRGMSHEYGMNDLAFQVNSKFSKSAWTVSISTTSGHLTPAICINSEMEQRVFFAYQFSALKPNRKRGVLVQTQ